jgi:hypothetical protein
MHMNPTPRFCASCIASSAQARGEKPDKSIVISVAHHAHPAPAQARSEKPDESIAISLSCEARQRLNTSACHAKLSLANYSTAWSRAAPRTRSLCAEPTREKTIPPNQSHSPHRSSPFTSFVMLGRGITTWRSAANAPEGVQNALMMRGAFVCCNGLLGHTRCDHPEAANARLEFR